VAFSLVAGWFSVSELVPFLIVIVAAVAALICNKPLAQGLAGFIGRGWPPGGLIREDRPDKIEEQRQLHRVALVTARFMVPLMAVFALGACVVVLIHGPD
jgi:hypothetical protein